MKKIQTKVIFIILAVLVLGAIIVVSARSAKNRAVVPEENQTVASKYDAFATCLKDKGAIFYGAFWCPHCNNQKEMFGDSKNLIPYVECSTPDGTAQLQVCKDKQVTGYPTWEFADGSRVSGEVPLATLAQKTSCVLPE